MKTIQELAGQMFDAFEAATRADAEKTTYYRLKDGSPEWMKEIVYHAHGSMLPDDYRYSWIQDACGAIHDAGEDGDLDDTCYSFADGVDVYNSALLAWVGSNLTRMGYVDEAMDESAPKDLASALQMGQYKERLEVFELVKEGLQEYLDNLDEDEEEDEEEGEEA